MPGPAAGESARAVEQARVRVRDAIVPLGILLALGLALRVIIAYVLLPGSGFKVDLASFNGWAVELATRGPWGFYGRDIFVDYTPGYLYVLWGLGLLAQLFGGPGTAPGDLLKLPAIFADLGLAVAVFALAAELGASRRNALIGAAVVLFVPVTWFDSAAWAQVDSVGTLVLLLAVRELWRGHSERAAILTTVAAIIKPQFGILIPLAAVVIIRRHWVERPADGSRLGGGPIRIATTTIAGIVTASLVCLPFGQTIIGLLEQILKTGGGYPYITVNAYNPWALVTMDGNGLASAGTWIRDSPNPDSPADPFFAPLGIPAVAVGGLLIAAAIVGLMVLLWRRHDDRRALLVALAVMAAAFFVLPIRVHERYLYPFFALGAILLALRPRWAAVYAVLATANAANLYGVLTLPFYENPGLTPMLEAFGGLGARLGEAIRSQAGVWLAAIGHAGGLVAAVVFMARPVAGETDHEDRPAAVPGPGIGWPSFRPAQADPAATDRSTTLDREGGGRLDRLDVWLLLVLLIATLGLRTFRLGEPTRMHFDEVYHARTATEFLQAWAYGKPHGIYEYTHPHLAKYAMAAGLVLLGNNRVVAESALGTPVRDAAIEPRWDEPLAGEVDPGAPTRGGERLYVATGDGVDVYDLRTRERRARFSLPGAQAVAVDPVARVVYAGTAGGEIVTIATDADGSPVPFATLGAPVERLWTAGEGDYVLAGIPGDGLAALDAATAAELSRITLPGRADVASAGRVPALVATPAEVADPATAAGEIAALVGGDEAAYRELLATDAPRVILTTALGDGREAVDAAIADGTLPGLQVQDVPLVAVADTAGVTFVEPSTGVETGSVALEAPATGLARVEGLDDPTLYAASGRSLAAVALPTADAPASLDQTVWMPGVVERVAFNPASQLVHVLGRTADGSASTVYVVEPRGNAVFADARLPFAPVAWAADTAREHPTDDRQQLLAFGPDGATAAIDIGHNAFAWRLPGVLAGALMGVLLYLLARILFRRRSVAILAGLFALADGMLFAQSRIAMNDAYVALFIVAAVALFAAIWTGAWRWRGAVWVGLPVVGLLLGLALASKWVALYAIGGIGVLILVRSALGRLLLVVGLAAIAATLGYIAISVGPEAKSGGNVIFLLLVVALAIVAAAAAVLHPLAWTVEEVRLAVAGPLAAGALLGLAAIALGLSQAALAGAVGLMALGGVAAGGFWLAGRLGLGPLAPPPGPDDPAALLEPAEPAPPGWLRPGWLAGIPILWAAVTLVGIPLAVYVVAYLPWVALGNQIVGPNELGGLLPAGWPPDNGGQTLLDLTRGMYDYHNNLRATHAAASPWWAWPANLKPVWFYQESFAGPTTGAIYDSGNLATWWLSIPAVAFVAWQAFRRRSLALGLVGIMIASLWLPWARIDRATFQYHYYTALPFVLLALAYFMAELWTGPSRRTWLLARGAAVGALMAPVALWLLRGPLCWAVDVERANAGSQACSGAASLPISLTAQAVGLILVIAGAGIALVWQLLEVDRAIRAGAGPEQTRPAVWRIWGTLGAGVVALAVVALAAPPTPLLETGSVPGEVLALLLLAVLAPLAWVVARAASPRRFAIGLVLVAGFVFVLVYPNISGLPLPTGFHNWYQGFLPTWLYPFQFPVNTDPVVAVSLASPWPLVLFVVVVLAAAFVAYSAWLWRLAIAERAAEDDGPAGPAPGRAAA